MGDEVLGVGTQSFKMWAGVLILVQVGAEIIPVPVYFFGVGGDKKPFHPFFSF